MTPAQVAHIMVLVDALRDADDEQAAGSVIHARRQALEAALRDVPQQAEGWVMVPADVVKFLTGEGPLDGLWFGEHPFGLGGGKYWWRKHLHAARPSAPTAVEPDEPLDMMKVIHDGFALFKYAQGTKECIAFNRGVRYAEQARASKGTPK